MYKSDLIEAVKSDTDCKSVILLTVHSINLRLEIRLIAFK